MFPAVPALLGGDPDQALLVAESERLQENRVDHTEDRGRRADAERQRQDRGDGKARRAAQAADGEAQVLDERLHGHSALRAAIGSTRAARRAGRPLATTATTASSRLMAAKVRGSRALIP